MVCITTCKHILITTFEDNGKTHFRECEIPTRREVKMADGATNYQMRLAGFRLFSFACFPRD